MGGRLVVIGGDAGGMAAATNARRRRSLPSRSSPSRRATGPATRPAASPTSSAAIVDGGVERLVARTPAAVPRRPPHRRPPAPRGHRPSTSTAGRSRSATTSTGARSGSASTTSCSAPAPARCRPDLPGIDAAVRPRRADPRRRRRTCWRTPDQLDCQRRRGRRRRLHRPRDGRGVRARGARAVTLVEGGRARHAHARPRHGRPASRTPIRGIGDRPPHSASPSRASSPGVVHTAGGSDRRRPRRARPRRRAQQRAGRRRRHRPRRRRAPSGSTAASARATRACGPPATAAESFHLVSRRRVHIALGTVANRQARVAGINIGGGYATFPGVVGTAVTKVCSTEVGPHRAHRARVRRRPASASCTATIESTTRAGYFPGAKPIAVKMLAEPGSGRVLGAQIVGEEGAAKRIDVVAMALHGRHDGAGRRRRRPRLRPAVQPAVGPRRRRRPQTCLAPTCRCRRLRPRRPALARQGSWHGWSTLACIVGSTGAARPDRDARRRRRRRAQPAAAIGAP